jgi:hypothetical protein
MPVSSECCMLSGRILTTDDFDTSHPSYSGIQELISGPEAGYLEKDLRVRSESLATLSKSPGILPQNKPRPPPLRS